MCEALGSRDSETERKQAAVVSFFYFLLRGQRGRGRLKGKNAWRQEHEIKNV